MNVMFRRTILVLATILAGAASPGLAQEQQALPPTPVSIVTLTPEPLPVISDLPGRIAATRTAEVRPRVSGIVVERVFEQGSVVEEGDVLYRIDPAQFRVRVASAEATLARARAALRDAQDKLARQERLRERDVSAEIQLENAITATAQAEADVAIAEANLAEAQLNLDYTEVTAPISGTIGRALVTEGALVTAQTDMMARIQQFDPVYADFTQSSAELRRLRKAMATGELIATAPNEASVQLFFDDGEAYQHRGRLLFSEATVDSTTGQVTLRGEFPNPNGELLPGLYVRVRIEQAVRDDALAIPQMSVLRDAQGNPQVYVVREDDTVELRTVRLGQSVGNRWIVEDGLAAGEHVVVAGAQKLFPDAKVAPEPWRQAQADVAPVQQAN